MLVCNRCQEEKDELCFYKKTETKHQSMCKKCFNIYCVDRWIERKKRIVEQFGGKCLDCKNSFPYPVFEFHHLDPSQKDLSWTKMRLVSEERLQNELSKCVMLCANCHRIRHYILNGGEREFLPKIERKKRKENFCSCGNKMYKRAKKCRSCHLGSLQSKIDWPSTSVLIDMVKESNYSAVARELGVSDNGLRKRIKNHSIP